MRCRPETRTMYDGFTLLELMVALAIVALLAAVAYPSYQNSIRKARRADGMAAAMAVQAAQEKFRGACPFYAQALGNGNVCGASAAASTVQAASTSQQGFYSLSIQAGSASGNAYTIIIDPTGAQAADTDCDPMQIAYTPANPGGTRSPAGCW